MFRKKQFFPWVIAAILMGISFPSFDQIPSGVFAWFAFVPILLSTEKLPAFRYLIFYASVHIIIFSLVDLWWVFYFDFWHTALVTLLQVPTLLLVWIGYYFIHKKFKWKVALLLFPLLLTISEYFIHQLPHGTQIYLYSYSQSNMIWLIQFVDFFGMWGIAFWLGILNVTFALAVKEKKIRYYILILFCLLAPLVYSVWCINLAPKNITGPKNKTTSVAIIQTNQNSYLQRDASSFEGIFSEIFSLSSTAVKTTKPDLLVFPESAVPLPILQNPEMLQATKSLVYQLQTSIAVGFANFPDKNNPHFFENNALVFTPQLATYWDSLRIQPEEVKVYQKEYGLPFAEITPYFEDVPTFRNQAMRRGHEPYTFNYNSFEGDKYKVGLSICWEQMFPHKMAALVNNGAQFLCFMNNDAWFGKTPGARQLRSFSRIRAIENRRSIVRSSNGGISCFIDPFGRISGSLPWYEPATTTEDVLCVDKISFFSRHPNWFPKICGLILLFVLTYLTFSRAKK